MLLKVPFVSTLIEHSELSRFSYINSILIKSNIPTVQAFKLSSDILKNEVLKKLFTQASQKVVEGKTLSSILESNNIYKIDNSFTQAIAIGEETSKLPQILTNLAVLYQESNSDKINILLSLIEPLFMLIVGGIIGAIVLSMLLPIFSMSVAV
jgi:general secretion pathway protein F/type IV pilus assembly protein PilC